MDVDKMIVCWWWEDAPEEVKDGISYDEEDPPGWVVVAKKDQAKKAEMVAERFARGVEEVTRVDHGDYARFVVSGGEEE